jgi:hypothetical protein
MVTDTTNSSTPNDLGHDPNFRENVRRQLEAKGAEGMPNMTDTYIPMVNMEPSEGRALRWVGGVVGTGIFLFGAAWFLAILGYSVPWYTAFPLLAMFVGGFFVLAAVVTRRDLKKRKI